MPRKPPYARIAITLPAAVLDAADQLARERDRSRSWIIADAVRQYASAGGLGDSRLAQLHRDLELTPEERVRAAEETLLADDRTQRGRRNQLLTFDRYEDYLEWKDAHRAR